MWRCAAVLGLIGLSACGGGSPGGPSSPPPTNTGPRASVPVVVFYDENGDGQLQGSEIIRIPGVDVAVGGAVAKTERGTGRAVVMAPTGAQAVELRADTLPPYYQPASPRSINVPPEGEVLMPLTLPIGDLRPNVYMAFGDSISVGVGSSDGTGYRDRLDQLLRPYLGDSEMAGEGRDGTQTDEGASRVGRALGRRRPAYTLIQYGTNDWNTLECQQGPPCDTIDGLREIIRIVKDFGSLPILSTIIPTNPAQSPLERNEWIAAQNRFIADLAREQRIALADPFRLFPTGQAQLPGFFADHVHPNDAGYDLIARAFFEAITGPRGGTSAAEFGPKAFGFELAFR